MRRAAAALNCAGAPLRAAIGAAPPREYRLARNRRLAMIHVIAVITAKPGMREAILREFRANMPAVHAEQGCLEYVPAIDAEGMGAFQTPFGPDTFVVVEKWASAAALKAHAAAPHMAAYAAKTREMIASRVIHVLSPAG
jgi:quinol monooxygenase YgiN